MNSLLEVRSGPTYYACEENILESLEKKLLHEKITKVLFVHGHQSLEVAQPYLPTFSNVEALFLPYQGECSDTEIERISTYAIKQEIEAVIGIGGGKVLDLVKSVGNHIHKDIILIPTLASTCAAWTPLSVIYDESGSYVRYDIHEKSAWIMLIEPRILLNSPLNYLRAGIGDTLAKWYEGNALVEQLKKTSVCIDLAHIAAKQCKDVLLQYSTKALDSLKNNSWTNALQQVIETNIVTSGLVGGFGDQYLRVAGAHSIHNGMTTISETHHLLHGEKVAYGNLIQLVLEEKFSEVHELIAFHQEINLPITLQHIGLTINQQDKISKIAEASIKTGESIHQLFPNITAQKIIDAIFTLEKIANE